MKTTSGTYWLLFVLLLISLGIFAMIASCDRQTFEPPVEGISQGDAVAGGGDTYRLQLVAEPSQTVSYTGFPSGGTATIRALAENVAGQPMPDGTLVVWSATVGSVSPGTSTTTSGIAETTLTFPRETSGCSRVTARSGEVTSNVSVCTRLVTPGPGVGTATPTPTPSGGATATPTPVSGATATPTPTPEKDELTLTSAAVYVSSGGTTTLTATVTTGGSAEPGIEVTFSIVIGSDAAQLLCSNPQVTNSIGRATCEIENQNGGTGAVQVTAKAVTLDGRSDTVQITMAP